MAYKFLEGKAMLSGALVPGKDDSFDLGSSTFKWKDAYIDGTLTADAATLTSVDINGGNIDGTVIGAASVAAGSFAAIVGTSADINGVGDLTEKTDIVSVVR